MTVNIGVVFPGAPLNPRTWSGTPAGLSRGLEASGVSVVALNVQPPYVLDFVAKNSLAALRLPKAWKGNLRATISFSRDIARASPELAVVHTFAAKRAVRKARPVDALVQIGTGYSIEANVPIVTLEDLTVLQAVELGYPEWRAFSSRAVKARVERQKRAYEKAVACCFTTHWAAESAIQDYDLPREKAHVVGVGRNHDITVTGRDWSTPRFLFIGRDWHGKNGPAVLRAFARLRTDFGTATLDVVGDHPRLTLPGVRGHGLLSLDNADQRGRVQELLQNATCFVLPSLYEAAAIAYVEAGAAALPCIGTKVGGATELIGDAGRVVDPFDENELLDAMRELSDPDTAARLGARAQQRAPLFTWRAVAERVLRGLSLPGVAVDSLAPFL